MRWVLEPGNEVGTIEPGNEVAEEPGNQAGTRARE